MKKTLKQINQEIFSCKYCLKHKIGVLVPGEGNPRAKIAFLGEAPGKQESVMGRPFVGRSGQLLRQTIRDVLDLDDIKDVYITSPVKYLPKKGTPTKQEIEHGRTHLYKQLEVIKPKIIVLMGNTAMYAMLDAPLTVTKNRGKIITKDRRKYFIVYHPAAVIRFPWKFKTQFLSDFRKLKKQL